MGAVRGRGPVVRGGAGAPGALGGRVPGRGLPEGVETQVDILCLSETIEEAVRSRLSDKIKLLQALLDDDDLSAMVFDPEDVEEYHEDEFISTSDLAAVMEALSK